MCEHADVAQGLFIWKKRKKSISEFHSFSAFMAFTERLKVKTEGGIENLDTNVFMLH